MQSENNAIKNPISDAVMSSAKRGQHVMSKKQNEESARFKSHSVYEQKKHHHIGHQAKCNVKTAKKELCRLGMA